ncbi:MAG: N-acetylmuramoyl-L-alanine amidase, partial [Candidatus Aminicenantes bacterium]|nr:N-acetylmuramoyl-L-alanine amidase [Candidatus Aminicenantes bacterium]
MRDPIDRTARGAVIVAALLVAFAVCPVSGQTPAAQGQRIQTMVIDPGHGGMETGAKGKFGNLEKNITLAISLKLKALIERNMGFEVVLT